MGMIDRLFNRPKRPSDGSACPSCGALMIPDVRIVRPTAGVELRQSFFHCTNRWCGHNLLRGEPTTDHTEIVTSQVGASLTAPRASEDE